MLLVNQIMVMRDVQGCVHVPLRIKWDAVVHQVRSDFKRQVPTSDVHSRILLV